MAARRACHARCRRVSIAQRSRESALTPCWESATCPPTSSPPRQRSPAARLLTLPAAAAAATVAAPLLGRRLRRRRHLRAAAPGGPGAGRAGEPRLPLPRRGAGRLRQGRRAPAAAELQQRERADDDRVRLRQRARGAGLPGQPDGGQRAPGPAHRRRPALDPGQRREVHRRAGPAGVRGRPDALLRRRPVLPRPQARGRQGGVPVAVRLRRLLDRRHGLGGARAGPALRRHPDHQVPRRRGGARRLDRGQAVAVPLRRLPRRPAGRRRDAAARGPRPSTTSTRTRSSRCWPS